MVHPQFVGVGPERGLLTVPERAVQTELAGVPASLEAMVKKPSCLPMTGQQTVVSGWD